jgi:GNAT superfamily N-acetyltransferase
VTAGVTVSRYDPRTDGDLADLLALLWTPDDRLNQLHLHWKYAQNPYAGTRILVARSGGEVIAMRGFAGARYSCGDAPHPAPVVVAGDLTIAPRFRGRGVHTALMKAALDDLAADGIEYILNFSANAAVRLGSLAGGWRTTASIERLMRPRREDPRGSGARGIRSRVARYARPFERSRSTLGRLIRSGMRWNPFGGITTGELGHGVSVSESPLPREMSDLLRRTESRGRIRHTRDEEYFGWRFRAPLSSYRFFHAGGSALDAFVILQARKYPVRGRIVRIADWAGVSAAARENVLTVALESVHGAAVSVWSSSLEPADRYLLARHGFVVERATSAADYTPAILVKPVASSSPSPQLRLAGCDMLDLASWNVRMIDSDGT